MTAAGPFGGLVLAIALLFAAGADAQEGRSGTSFTSVFPAAPQFDAQSPMFGSCSWTLLGDVGPCIQNAINAAETGANALIGGTVILPGGVNAGFKTNFAVNTPGVGIVGVGAVSPHDIAVGNTLLGTRLVYTGAAEAGPAFDAEPTSGALSLYGNNFGGFSIDCALLVTTCARLASINYSNFNFAVQDGIAIDLDASTTSGAGNPGSQHNTGSIFDYYSGASATHVGLLFRKDPGSTSDWSLNTFAELYANVAAGVPMEFVNGDRNTVMQLTTYGGSPAIVANSAITLPNSLATQTPMWRNMFVVANDAKILLQGLQSGSTLVATAVAGTEGPTTVGVTTAATAALGNPLNVVSSAGVNPGEVLNVTGGYAAGVAPNSQIQAVGAGTLTLAQGTVGAVGSSTGIVSYGVSPTAVSGAYTIVFNGTDYTVTAPTGGHTQAHLAPSAGALTATDFTIPWTTGVPVPNDTFTLTTPAAFATNNNFLETDNGLNGNAIPNPGYEAGATGCFGGNGTQSCAYSLVGSGVFGSWTNVVSNGAQGSWVIGGAANAISASAVNATIDGGNANQILGGLGDAIEGGSSGSISSNSNYSAIIASLGSKITGTQSLIVGGSYANDFGLFGMRAYASGEINTPGDAELLRGVLRGSAVSGSPATLTTNGTGADGTTNCFNIPDNTTIGIRLSFSVQDHANQTYWGTWQPGVYIGMHRGVGAASTVASVSSLSASLPASPTLTGTTVSATADTANGCVKLQMTSTSTGSDTIDYSAHGEGLVVQ
jgi:hypothetical protein